MIRKIAVTLVAVGAGVAAGTVAATPVIAVANRVATDGPDFPAPLVAFGFVALPIGVLLFAVQVAVLAYEGVTRGSVGGAWWVIGVLSGVTAGLGWYLVLASFRPQAWMLWTLGALGAVQALVVLACHRLAERRVLRTTPPAT